MFCYIVVVSMEILATNTTSLIYLLPRFRPLCMMVSFHILPTAFVSSPLLRSATIIVNMLDLCRHPSLRFQIQYSPLSRLDGSHAQNTSSLLIYQPRPSQNALPKNLKFSWYYQLLDTR